MSVYQRVVSPSRNVGVRTATVTAIVCLLFLFFFLVHGSSIGWIITSLMLALSCFLIGAKRMGEAFLEIREGDGVIRIVQSSWCGLSNAVTLRPLKHFVGAAIKEFSAGWIFKRKYTSIVLEFEPDGEQIKFGTLETTAFTNHRCARCVCCCCGEDYSPAYTEFKRSKVSEILLEIDNAMLSVQGKHKPENFRRASNHALEDGNLSHREESPLNRERIIHVPLRDARHPQEVL
jgi:hypothetical protein